MSKGWQEKGSKVEGSTLNAGSPTLTTFKVDAEGGLTHRASSYGVFLASRSEIRQETRVGQAHAWRS
jgi:hypothetical protein